MKQKWNISQAAQELKISTATLRNWIKNGSLPIFREDPVFFPLKAEEMNRLREEIQNSKKLQSRVNRAGRERSFQYPRYYQKWLENYSYNAEQWIYLFFSAIKKDGLQRPENFKRWQRELDSWDIDIKDKFPEDFMEALCKEYPLDPAGELYQWLQPVQQRIGHGSFYTPLSWVKPMVEKVPFPQEGMILDPAAGSGRFLLEYIKDGGSINSIIAVEKNPLSWRICRMNLLRISPEVLEEIPVYQGDSLKDTPSIVGSRRVNLMVTNPPWGSTPKAHPVDGRKSSHGDLFADFLQLAMDCLAPGGRLLYLLPQSLLFQKKFSLLRKELRQMGQIERVKLYDRKFKGIQSPPMALYWKKEILKKIDTVEIELEEEKYPYQWPRMDDSDHSWYFYMQPGDCQIEKQMNQCCPVTFADMNPQWLMGIVTGDNRSRLKKHKEPVKEGLIRGRDIQPGWIAPSFISLNCSGKELQQQAACSSYSSHCKLLYRFIGSRPIAALDREGRTMLNSANGLILPEERQMELAELLLNSSLYAHLYLRKFHSIKILRSHLERLPFPHLSENQWEDIAPMLRSGSASVENRKRFEEWLIQYYRLEEL